MHARLETGFCVSHDPTYADIQRLNNKLAGFASGEALNRIPLDLEDLPTLHSRGEIGRLLDTVMYLDLAGRISAGKASRTLRAIELRLRQGDVR